MFQHTAARRRLGIGREESRRASACFNTQPPEGGWIFGIIFYSWTMRFQHTAARRRLGLSVRRITTVRRFQHTAARRRLVKIMAFLTAGSLFQHTAARRRLVIVTMRLKFKMSSFNTQPPEGGWATAWCGVVP